MIDEIDERDHDDDENFLDNDLNDYDYDYDYDYVDSNNNKGIDDYNYNGEGDEIIEEEEYSYAGLLRPGAHKPPGSAKSFDHYLNTQDLASSVKKLRTPSGANDRIRVRRHRRRRRQQQQPQRLTRSSPNNNHSTSFGRGNYQFKTFSNQLLEIHFCNYYYYSFMHIIIIIIIFYYDYTHFTNCFLFFFSYLYPMFNTRS